MVKGKVTVMNLVGKIFIVLVFVMSVLFMGFAVAIYASHTNWREVVEAPDTGLKAQLEKEKAESGRLTGERDRMQEQMASAEDDRAKVLADLQTELQVQSVFMLCTKLEEIIR